MSIKLTPRSKAILRKTLGNADGKMEKALKRAIFQVGNELKNDGVRDAPHDTGTLRRSIRLDKKRGGYAVSVGSSLKYARIHDQGGMIRAHVIRPRKSRYLHFWAGGQEVFTKLVKKPSRKVAPYRGKGYLTPAFKKQERGEASKTIERFVTKEFNG